MTPDLVAEMRLYPPDEGGRTQPVYPGYGCPCMVTKMQPLAGYDGWPILGDEPLYPGECRRVGFVFLVPESADTIRRAGRFYLWDGKFIGEAEVIQE